MPPIRKIGTLFYDLEARTKQFERSMASSGTSAKKLGAIIRAHPVAAAATMAAAFILVAAKATKMAAALEQSFGEISTLVDTTKVDVGELQVEMLHLFASMPVDQLEDMSRGLYQIISASIPAAQSLDFLRIATEASVAGLTSVEVAVDGLTTVVNAWAASNITATEVADSMFTAVRFGKTTFDQIATSVGRVAGLAATMGISFDDVLVNATALTLGGVDMELAMRSIRQVLANVIRPTTALVTKFPEVAKVFNRAKLEADGLTKFMVDLAQALKGNEDAAVLMFQDVNALNAALQLTGEDGKRITRLWGEWQKKAGASALAFSKMAKTTVNLAKVLKNQFGVVMIALGQEVLPTVNVALQTMIELMRILNGEVDRMNLDNLNNELKFMVDNFDLLSTSNLRDLSRKTGLGRNESAGQSRIELFQKVAEVVGQASEEIVTFEDALKAVNRATVEGLDLGGIFGTSSQKILTRGVFSEVGNYIKFWGEAAGLQTDAILNLPGQSDLNQLNLGALLSLEKFFSDATANGIVAVELAGEVEALLEKIDKIIGERRASDAGLPPPPPLTDKERRVLANLLLGLPGEDALDAAIAAFNDFRSGVQFDVRKKIASALGSVQQGRDLVIEGIRNDLNAEIEKTGNLAPGLTAIFNKLIAAKKQAFKAQDDKQLASIATDLNRQIATNLGDFEGLRDLAFESIRTEMTAAFDKLPEHLRAALEPSVKMVQDTLQIKFDREDAASLLSIQQQLAGTTTTLIDDMTLNIEQLEVAFETLPDKSKDAARAYIDAVTRMRDNTQIAEDVGKRFEEMGQRIADALLLLDFGDAGFAIDLLPDLQEQAAELEEAIAKAKKLGEKFGVLKQELDGVNAALKIFINRIADAADGMDDVADALEKQRRLLQAGARQIESMVRGALQLASAFDIVSESVSDVVQGLVQAVVNAKDLAFLLEQNDDKTGLRGSALQIAGAALPVVGGFAQAFQGFQGLFGGPSPEELQRLELLRKNNDALAKLAREIGNLGILGDVSGRQLLNVREALGEAEVDLTGARGVHQQIERLREAHLRYGAALARLGLSTEDIREVAAGLGITFADTLPTMAELNKVLQAFDLAELTTFAETIGGQLSLLELEFALFDIENPIEQLQRLQDVINERGGLFGGTDKFDFGVLEPLGDLDLGSAEGRAAAEALIQQIFRDLAAGKITLEDLGDLSVDQLIELMKKIEDGLDIQEATEGSGGFNVSRTITEVTGNRMVGELTTANVHLAEIAASTLVLATATLMANVGVRQAPGPLIHIEQLVIAADPLNPEGAGTTQARAFMEEVDRQQGDRLRQRQLGSGTVIRE